jgi:hypothetical protein
MMFYDMAELDDAWERYCHHCRTNPAFRDFRGKVSTALKNPFATDPDMGVIIAYCYGTQRHTAGARPTAGADHPISQPKRGCYYKPDAMTTGGRVHNPRTQGLDT